MTNLPILHILPSKILCALSFVIMALGANAQTIVTWGPSSGYVPSHTNASGLVDGEVAFTDSVPINPPLPYPNGEPSGTFYGGIVSENSGGVTIWRIANNLSSNGGTDAISAAGSLLAGESLTMLYLWNKADFQNGYDVVDAEVTSMAGTFYHTGAGASTLSGEIRWLVKVDGSYYVSDGLTTATTPQDYELNDMGSVDWYNINPAVSISTIGAQWGSPDFTNVEGVGIWHQLNASGSVGAAQGLVVSLDATAIPEPASFSLVFAGFLGVLIVMRLRRK